MTTKTKAASKWLARDAERRLGSFSIIRQELLATVACFDTFGRIRDRVKETIATGADGSGPDEWSRELIEATKGCSLSLLLARGLEELVDLGLAELSVDARGRRHWELTDLGERSI
jgi:hypothetical protein